jgi:hypothetical protein
MTVLLFLAVIVFIILPIIGFVAFAHYKRLFREQKNFERGLKMVPLLIHLPPLSDDTDENGRDVRDMIDENISKAQVLYSIVASTIKKGFKSRFYGQRHFGFEIIASHGTVNYYAAVPVALVDVVKQAVISAYPSAQLEEVAEHNIFSPIGRITGTVGGELSLKENYAYPIATYQELKRDAMQSILNALSTLEKEDGAGIQFLMRPAEPEWRKGAHSVASKKRKGEDKKKTGPDLWFNWLKQVIIAFERPPEHKDGSGDKKELSSLDQAVVDSIDDKTRYPGYEVMIRVIASSNDAARAQTIKNNMVAAFALFDAPGKNGFKYTEAADIESFVTAFILRFFPQESNKNILNSVELATMFHFPDQKNIPTTQLQRQASKQVDGPRNMPEDGLLLGYNVFRGVKKPIRLSLEDRRRHMYVVGQTGVGKSIFLENLALQDMLAGRGFAFVDPHGETVDRLISMVPRERTEDVIYFSPADMDYPMGLNLFEYYLPEQKDFLIQEAINMLYKLYDPQHQGIIGPRYEHWFRNAALTVMANPDVGTFIDIPKVFTDKNYEKQLKAFVTDKTVLDFWDREMAATSDYHKSEMLGWFVSKFGAFVSNEMMRNIIGQSKSAFNLRDVMDKKKILLVNLSKGRTGELNSNLLGMIFVMKFQAAAMSRASVPEDQRPDFCLYVDEFQNFSTDSFATILSEARKYHLNLIVANQFTTQLTDEIRDAVFGNVGTIVSFRVGADQDADALSKKFSPIFDREDVLRIPNFNTITQMLISGVPTQPFSMATIPPLGTPNEQLGTAIRQLSAAKYGRARAQADKEIMARLTTKEVAPVPGAPASPFAGGPGGPNRAPLPGQSGGAPMPPPRSAAPASFLDDWLAKRTQPGPALPARAPTGAPMMPGASLPGQPAPLLGQIPGAPIGAPNYGPAPATPIPAPMPSLYPDSFGPAPSAVPAVPPVTQPATPTPIDTSLISAFTLPSVTAAPAPVPDISGPIPEPVLASPAVLLDAAVVEKPAEPTEPEPEDKKADKPKNSRSGQHHSKIGHHDRKMMAAKPKHEPADPEASEPAVEPIRSVAASKPKHDSANISSNDLEDQEIASVADELRSSLKASEAAAAAPPATPPAPPAVPLSEIAKELGGALEPADNSHGEIHLGKTRPASIQSEDTIYIDNDGVLHSRADDPAA